MEPIIESIVKTLEAEKIEEPDIQLFVEAILEAAEEEADEAVIEETVVESTIEAILEAAERVEIVRDIAAEESRLYLRPLKESRNLLSNHLSRLYVIRPLEDSWLYLIRPAKVLRLFLIQPPKKSKDPWSNRGRSKTLDCL